jgi:hypothetical protein
VEDFARRGAGGSRNDAADVRFVRKADAEADELAAMKSWRDRTEIR